MSRIPFRGAVVASSTVSVAAMCLLGGFASASSAAENQRAHKADVQNARRGDYAVTLRNTGHVASFASGAPQPFAIGVTELAPRQLTSLFAPVSEVAAAASSTLTAAAAAEKAAQTKAAAAAAAAAAAKAKADAAARAAAAQRTAVRSAALGAVSGSPRAMAEAMAANRGWTGAQWTCLDELWGHESQFETTARNSSSGAYGIPQALPASKMGSAGADWLTNPVTQISWGLGYIADRYGTPCGAWSHWTYAYSY